MKLEGGGEERPSFSGGLRGWALQLLILLREYKFHAADCELVEAKRSRRNSGVVAVFW